MNTSERTPINGEVYPFHLSQKPISHAFCDFLLPQIFDGDNCSHSHNPAIKNQALNALAKSLGHPQFSTMMATAKKHQQQVLSNMGIADHPNFLTLFPLHYAETMEPHVSAIPFSNPNFSQFLRELTTKQLRFRLRKNANGTFSATIAAENGGWYRGWDLQLPKLALTSKVAFFTVILQWYHTLVNIGYDIDFNSHFVFENSLLLNVSCSADLIQDCDWYQRYWHSSYPLNAEIEGQFSDIDQRLNEHIRQENIPYDFERYGEISLRTHIFSLNQNGLVVPNAYFNSGKLRKLQPKNQRPIVLMDLCTIQIIEKYKKIESGQNKVLQERVRQLRGLIAKSYRFSFLLAMMEKATDKKHVLSRDDLIDVFKGNYESIVDFVGKENIVEPAEILEKMLSVYMDERYAQSERAEQLYDKSLEFLEYFAELRAKHSKYADIRFKLAEEAANEGKRLGLPPGYSPITICIASLYECEDANGVLKIKGYQNDFEPGNCLSDIMSFNRLAKAKATVETAGIEVIFRTEDLALERLHQYIYAKQLVGQDGTPTIKTTFSHPEKLFPKLYKNGKCINESERNKLFALLNFKMD
ncbi:hypothetical protein [Providencia rettgeri]|uniref:hypothetical protein n=1 Tax=Providencia rettgeri TaxID=587 RepID=UPI0034E0DACC